MSTNENQETIADIAAFIRKCLDLLDNELSRKSNGETSMSAEALLCPVLNAKAALNRIEAAWKLEKSQSWHQREMEELILRHEKEVIELKKQISDSSAMREAILSIKDINDRRPHDADGYEINDIINDALSAPPRNCDIARDWMHDLYCKFKPPATVRREMPPEWVDAVMEFCKWLLSTATERKGEGDESK